MVEWNVLEKTDQAVREYLGNGNSEDDLPTFVDKAVRGEILRKTIRKVQAQNTDLSEDEAMNLADEAIAWTRENRP